MATSTRLSLSEYMKTSYRPDREFVDGELRERNVGKWEHARLQALLASWFQSQEKSWSVKVATEQRVQVSPTRVRILDVMLVPRGPQAEVAVDPPVLVVEILSPDDSYTETQSRSADYLHMRFRAFGSLIQHPGLAASASETRGQPPIRWRCLEQRSRSTC
jgi:Uma2 family endonuclease